MKNIDVDLTDEEILFLALKAHEKDITLNQYINNLIKDYIIEQENK